jgi:hypothetical protein
LYHFGFLDYAAKNVKVFPRIRQTLHLSSLEISESFNVAVEGREVSDRWRHDWTNRRAGCYPSGGKTATEEKRRWDLVVANRDG